MKNFLFLVAVTLGGGVGATINGPVVPVMVYYFYACLRPHSLWKFQLAAWPDIGWSFYSAVIALVSYLPWVFGIVNPNDPLRNIHPRFIYAHRLLIAFAVWQTLSYLNANDQVVAGRWYGEYLKIFAIYLLGTQVIRSFEQIRWLYLIAALSLGYIALEVVWIYLKDGYPVFYKRGYDGLDNNGAALMVALAIPLLYFGWEFTTGKQRWLYLALIPVVGEAVMSSYSRGAMLSVLAVSPLYLLYTRRRLVLILIYVAAAVAVPIVAGAEIKERFGTMFEEHEDGSFASRKDSWRAARLIANDYPVFGAGVRCSNLISKEYGADLEGRTIHNIYLQIAADSGWVGLGLYVGMIGSGIVAMWKARRRLWNEPDPESRRAVAMLGGIECSLWTFLVGAMFLSLETFEPPYLLLLMGGQILAITAAQVAVPKRPKRPAPPRPVRGARP